MATKKKGHKPGPKKTGKKRTTHRRRGIHGFSAKGIQAELMDVALLTAGSLASGFLENSISKIDFFKDKTETAADGTVKTSPNYFRMAAPLAVGIGVAGMSKNPMLKNFGRGMAIQGMTKMAHNLVPGIGAVSDADIVKIMEDIRIAGNESVRIGEADSVRIGEEISMGTISDAVDAEMSY